MGCFCIRFSHDGKTLAAACAGKNGYPIVCKFKICFGFFSYNSCSLKLKDERCIFKLLFLEVLFYNCVLQIVLCIKEH